MHTITLELDLPEAHIVLGRITDAALDASLAAAKSKGDERELLDVTSKVLARVQTRLTDLVFPTCSVEDGYGWRCPDPVDINGMCNYHDRMTA